eukprot:TRINITY_DN3671_c0_g1_i2.p1 TRINITY_DN3671_c0_g1~~TRINITY_DN3671_c0_g1_i2.p1  ORF type:complete len:286 (-),score=47.33 TRINITY_DN3671_c0_g1_i2:110-967(-)
MYRKVIKEYKKLPAQLSEMWKPLLDYLSVTYPHFIHTMLLMIAHRVTESKIILKEDVKRRYYNCLMLCWYTNILENYAVKPNSTGVRKFVIPYVPILHMCATKIDKWTIKMIKRTLPWVNSERVHKIVESSIYYFDWSQDIKRQERGMKSKTKKRSASIAFPSNPDDSAGLKDCDEMEPILQSIKKRQKVTTTDEDSWSPVFQDDSPGIGLLNGKFPSLEVPKDAVFEYLVVPKETKKIEADSNVRESSDIHGVEYEEGYKPAEMEEIPDSVVAAPEKVEIKELF